MLYTFENIKTKNHVKLFGNKAKSLVDLINWNIPVPNGCCITTEGLQSFIEINNFSQEIETLLNLVKKESTDHFKAQENIKKLQSMILEGKFPTKLKDQIVLFLSNNPNEHFAVRSSGSMEDLEGLSFAGLYTSVLNVIGEDELLRAVKKCWASIFSYRVLKYCFDKKIDINEMLLAVIIQKMIPAEKSGVLFTVNPINGSDKEVLIEACFGLGEAVVSGQVSPDLYSYNWFDKIENQRNIQEKEIAIIPVDEYPFTEKINLPEFEKKKEVLSQEEVKVLTEIAINIQSKYGFPVDIEWVKYNNKFFIVQSRPITKINFTGVENEWTTADFKDGGVSSTVCAPFMWSLYQYIWDITMPSYLKKANLIEDDKGVLWSDMFFGRPYWNLGAVKNGLKRLPDFNEKSFDESLGIEIIYKDKGFVSKTNLKTIWTGIKVLKELKKNFREQMTLCPKFKSQQKKRLQELNKIDIASKSNTELFDFYKKFIKEEFFISEATYFYLIFDGSNVTTLFRKTFDKIKNEPINGIMGSHLNREVNYLNLISGLTELSHLKQNYKLWDLIQKIKNNTKAYEYWKTELIPQIIQDLKANKKDFLIPEFKLFLEEFKYHSTRELDLMVPRYIEDPTYVIENIKTNIDFDESLNPREINKKQHEIYEEEKKYLLEHLPFYKIKRIKSKLNQLRNFLWWREELRDFSTQFYYYIRIFTLELSKRFYEMKILENQNDIFFLAVNDIYNIIDEKISNEEIKNLIQKNKIYYQSFRNFQNPNEIGNRYKIDSKISLDDYKDTHIFKGVACSPGIIKGKVKVIKDIFDADRLERGDILITKFTDPGWTPKFSLLLGVATETGGILSHAAAISREYGIPAVLAIPNITKILKDGQIVTIDGNSGNVIIEKS